MTLALKRKRETQSSSLFDNPLFRLDPFPMKREWPSIIMKK